MKLLTSIFTFAFVILLAVCVNAQPDYLVSAVNGTLVDDYNLDFEIYILRTGSTPLELAGFQTSIYFSDNIRNGGSLTGAYIAGTSGLSTNETPNVPVLTYTSSSGTIHQFRIAPRIPVGTGNGTVISNVAPGTRLGKFRITNTVAFNKTTAVNWQWSFTSGGENYSSYINAYQSGLNTDITNANKFQMSLPDPLQPATTFQLTVSVAGGWNMVSIPGLLPSNQNVTSWWPGKDPAASVFRFLNGYQAVTVASAGQGYWMKNLASQTYNTGDEWPAGGIQIVNHDPVPGLTGWNMIGGYEQTVNTSAMTTTPPGLITGTIYKYVPGSGYQSAAQLVPGFGYWVKLTGNGSINIPAPGPSKITDNGTSDLGKITFTDFAGKSYTLYAAKTAMDLTKYELPPLPPQGVFDIRFTSSRFVENITSSAQPVDLAGVQYPVKIKTEKVNIILRDETGKEITRLTAGEEYILNNASRILVAENVIPEEYALEQNYPNPFNPSTTIEFALPEASANVKVTVYNMLGQKVNELFSGSLEAGKYSFRWEAGTAASGTYIYELRTEKFVSARKMVLLR